MAHPLFFCFDSPTTPIGKHINLVLKQAGMSAINEQAKRFSYLLGPVLVFLITYAVFVSNNDNIRPADAVWTEHVAASLLYSGDSDLNEYLPVLEDRDFYATFRKDESIYYLFPIGTPLLVAPLLLASNIAMTALGFEDVYSHLQTASSLSDIPLNLNLIHASFFVSVTAALIYVIARRKLTWPYAALLAMAFAFGTSAYSTASRALWQQGPSMLMLVITIYFFVRAEEDSRWVRFAGIPLAFAFVVRPTNSVAILVFTLLVLLRYRNQLWHYLLGALLVAIPFIIYNVAVFATVFPPYYVPNRIGQSAHFWEALVGNWISPARGLLIFTPIIIFAGVGVLLMIKKRTARALDYALILIILLHWIVISSFDHWWGGFTFGPRFFTDMMPLFVLLMIPVLQSVADTGNKLGPRLLLGIGFTCTLILSLFIHHQGATEPATWMWNSVPIFVDSKVTRLWDWSDLQFLRGLDQNQVFVRPTRINLPLSSAEVDEQVVTLSLYNAFNRPSAWEIQLPRDVKLTNPIGAYTQAVDEYGGPLLVQKQQAPRFGKSDIKVRFEYPDNYNPEQTLSGIRVRARDELGQAINETLQIVPIGFGFASEDEDSAGYGILPEDISVAVDETGQSNDLTAAYGYGWYDLEKAEQAQWRWATSPAYLYLHTNEAGTVAINVKFSAVPEEEAPGEENEMIISVNGTDMPAHGMTLDQPMAVEVPLQAGWNQLVFQSSASNHRPVDVDPQSGDGRLLNFAIESIEITSPGK